MSSRLTIEDLGDSIAFKKNDAESPSYEFNFKTGEIKVNGTAPTAVNFSSKQLCSVGKCHDCTTVNCTTIQCTTIQCTTVQCTTVQCSGYCTGNCLNCTNRNSKNYDYTQTQCNYNHCYNCANNV